MYFPKHEKHEVHCIQIVSKVYRICIGQGCPAHGVLCDFCYSGSVSKLYFPPKKYSLDTVWIQFQYNSEQLGTGRTGRKSRPQIVSKSYPNRIPGSKFGDFSYLGPKIRFGYDLDTIWIRFGVLYRVQVCRAVYRSGIRSAYSFDTVSIRFPAHFLVVWDTGLNTIPVHL